MKAKLRDVFLMGSVFILNPKECVCYRAERVPAVTVKEGAKSERFSRRDIGLYEGLTVVFEDKGGGR